VLLYITNIVIYIIIHIFLTNILYTIIMICITVLIGMISVLLAMLMSITNICSSSSSSIINITGGKMVSSSGFILINHINGFDISPIYYYNIINSNKDFILIDAVYVESYNIIEKTSNRDAGYLAISNVYHIDTLNISKSYMYENKSIGVVVVKYITKDNPTEIVHSVRFSSSNSLTKYMTNYVTNKLKCELTNHIHTLVNSNASLPSNKIFDFFAVHTLDKEIIINNRSWFIAPKLDGTTYAVVTYKNIIYAINNSYVEIIESVTKNVNDIKDSMFICERIDNAYYILDVLYYNNKFIGQEPFYARYGVLKTIDISIFPHFYKQEYCNVHPHRNTYRDCLNSISEMRIKHNDNGINTDGLIFQPAGARYFKDAVYKYKNYDELSIDLLNIDNKLYVTDKGQLLLLSDYLKTANVNLKTSVNIDISNTSVNIVKNNILVVQEFMFVKVENKRGSGGSDVSYVLTYNRDRQDKYKSNSTSVLDKMVYLLDIKINFDDINGETIYLLKSYLRIFQESTLLPFIKKNEGSKSTLLDLGAGDGRMSKFWKDKKLTVTAIEPDIEFFKTLKNRIADSHLLTGEDPKIKKIIKPGSMQYIYMSYNLHFFFKNSKTLSSLISNINHVSDTGSYLIGISLDGTKVRDQLKLDSTLLDNKSFVIKETSDITKSSFGNEITITMKNKSGLVQKQIEYLSDFDIFTSKLQKIGFTLVKSEFVPPHETLSESNNWFATSTRYWIFHRR
jgi:hypothetical protein